ncbi:MAG TPA: HEAT repeat domain-containing protein [Polyangia bacterium]|nr:HEAT repeat domain-containing protein [Polyangia bacterium]
MARADRVDDLTRTLREDSSYKVRTQAALVLGKLGDARAVEPLIAALRDENEAVRAAAAAALGQIGDGRGSAALAGLRQDSSSLVRMSAEKALARLGTQTQPTHPPGGVGGEGAGPGAGGVSPAGARFYVTVNVTRGPAEAVRALRDALTEELGKLPRVTTTFEGKPSPTTLAARKLTAWQLDTSISNLRASNGQLDCDVNLAITAMPNHVIRATASAGASVSGAQGPSDTGAQRDCLAGAAQQLAEEVGKFFRTQH